MTINLFENVQLVSRHHSHGTVSVKVICGWFINVILH